MNISIIDIVIDAPVKMWLSGYANALKTKRLAGHNVLYVMVRDMRATSEVHVPHPGHNNSCTPNHCARLTNQYKDRDYVRHSGLALVVEGSLHLGDAEHLDYRLDGGAMVMLSGGYIEPEVEDFNRTELMPWED